MDFSKFLQTGELSDILVTVDGRDFRLHKFPLYAKSEYFRTLATGKDAGRVTLINFPGGADTFQLVANHCYNVPVSIDDVSVCALRCAADYLLMSAAKGVEPTPSGALATEESTEFAAGWPGGDTLTGGKGSSADLVTLTDRYLADALTLARMGRKLDRVLRLVGCCERLGEAVERTPIVTQCIRTIVDAWLLPMKFIRWNPSDRPSLDVQHLTELCHWFPLAWFQQLIAAARARGVHDDVIVVLLELYIHHQDVKSRQPPDTCGPDRGKSFQGTSGVPQGGGRSQGSPIRQDTGDQDRDEPEEVLDSDLSEIDDTPEPVGKGVESSVKTVTPPRATPSKRELKEIIDALLAEMQQGEIKVGDLRGDRSTINQAISPQWVIDTMAQVEALGCSEASKTTILHLASCVLPCLSASELTQISPESFILILQEACRSDEKPDGKTAPYRADVSGKRPEAKTGDGKFNRSVIEDSKPPSGKKKSGEDEGKATSGDNASIPSDSHSTPCSQNSQKDQKSGDNVSTKARGGTVKEGSRSNLSGNKTDRRDSQLGENREDCSDLRGDQNASSREESRDQAAREEHLRRVCRAVETYLGVLSEQGALTPDLYRRISEAVPGGLRVGEDTFFHVVEGLLNSDMDNDEKRKLLETIDYDRLSETSLQRALDSQLLPEGVIARAALGLCARLRGDLEAARASGPIRRPGDPLPLSRGSGVVPRWGGGGGGDVGSMGSSLDRSDSYDLGTEISSRPLGSGRLHTSTLHYRPLPSPITSRYYTSTGPGFPYRPRDTANIGSSGHRTMVPSLSSKRELRQALDPLGSLDHLRSSSDGDDYDDDVINSDIHVRSFDAAPLPLRNASFLSSHAYSLSSHAPSSSSHTYMPSRHAHSSSRFGQSFAAAEDLNQIYDELEMSLYSPPLNVCPFPSAYSSAFRRPAYRKLAY